MIVGLRGTVRRVGLDHAVVGVGGFDLKGRYAFDCRAGDAGARR